MTETTIQERARALADYNERQLYPENRCDTVDELREAADRIDALEAENARLTARIAELEEALRPFAGEPARLVWSDVHRARKALEG